MERLCINCKHYVPPEYWSNQGMQCAALRGKQHPVLGGDISTIAADVMRLTLCGWSDPKLWEQKP